MIGQKLNNRYTITARLGRGAMGTVYRATDTQSGRDVAVKVISSELAVDPDMLERFKREGKALSKLKHPNIVGFVDAFQHDEQYLIVMEYVSGGSLYELIKAGPLSIEHGRQIALDLCDALIRAHRLNIIHRDLKPENVLIDEDGTPKLADFGVARLSEGTRMTRSGVQVGTPYYMSPEAWEGRTLDAQADIWSLGVVLFEMLAGQVPFGGDTPLAVMSKISTTPPPDLRKLRADVPSGLVRIIGKMLTRDKRWRYQTMREVAVDLERVRQSTTPLPIKVKPDDSAKIERERERRAARKAALTKNVNAVLSSLKSALTRPVAGSKSAVSKVLPYFVLAGIIGVSITLIYFFFRTNLAAVKPMVFSIATSSDKVAFYLYGAAIPIIDAGDGNNWDPIVSPRGEIYFTSNREDNKAEIYRLINGEAQRVTNTPGEFESWGPAFSNLGEVYFTSNRDGKAEIYRLMESGDPQRVTNTLGQSQSWGPVARGQDIYFTSNRSNKNEVYLLKLPIRSISILGLDTIFDSWTNYFDERCPSYQTTITPQFSTNCPVDENSR
jgi:serine/threonine protein kinase